MTFPAPNDLARHERPGCNAPLVLMTDTRLVMENLWSPPHWQPMVCERCGHCGRLVNWWGVVEET